MTMRILIVGAGATGGYFGARLAAAGRDVTFLVRPARAAALRRGGLRVSGPGGDFAVAPALLTADRIAGPFDVVMLTVKAPALPRAMADCRAAIGADTMVLPVLNGMGHIAALRERFGPWAVLGGTCRIQATLDADGRVVQMTPADRLAYGEWGGGTTPRVRALDAALRGAGFDAVLSADIGAEMWRKWVLLATLGAATCLLRGSVGDIAAAPGGAATAGRLLDEVAAIAAAAGHAPDADELAAVRALATAAGSRQTTSMFRDLCAGLPVEADQILGDLLAYGRRHALASPLLDAAYAQLSMHQRRLADGPRAPA